MLEGARLLAPEEMPMTMNRAARRAQKTRRPSVPVPAQEQRLLLARQDVHQEGAASALEGAASATVLAGEPTAHALHSLLRFGPNARNYVSAVLALAERTLPDRFGLPGRLRRAAAEVDRAVALAHQAVPGVLDVWALSLASRTVAHVTGHLLSEAELLALARGAGQPEANLGRVRQALLLESGILDRTTAVTARRLSRADQTCSAAVSHGHGGVYTLPDPAVEERDRACLAEPDLDLRLGLVLLGEPRPMNANEVLYWYLGNRPGVYEQAIHTAAALRALGEEPMAGYLRVHDLLVEALSVAGASLLSYSVRGQRSVVNELTMRLVHTEL